MIELPWYAIIFISLPQNYIIIVMGLSLFNLEIAGSKCLLISFVVAVAAYFIRLLPVAFGIHTGIQVVLFTIGIVLVNKGKFLHCLSGVMLGIVILGVLENTALQLLNWMKGISIGYLSLHPWVTIACYQPVLLTAIMLCLIIRRYEFTVFDLSAGDLEL